MDNVTHTLTGLAIAKAGIERASRGATLALLLGSNLPDVDLLFGLQGATSYLQHHRDLSHSVVGAPLLALLLAAGLRLALRGSRFLGLALASLLGVAAHVLMDLLTSYGTRVLAPFDRTFYTWDLLFIVDPYVLAALALTLLLCWRTPQPARFATLGLGVVLAYVGARGVLHAQALDTASALVPGGARIAALPTPLDPWRWRILADAGPAYWTGQIRLGERPAPFVRRDKRPQTATVTRVRESSEVASVFLSFSTFPWLEVHDTPAGTEITWRDLRFERADDDRFVTRVVVGRDGKIASQEFHF